MNQLLSTTHRNVPSSCSDPHPLARAMPKNGGFIYRALDWLRLKQMARSSAARLQVVSNVSLGEKRFVALIQTDSEQFLVGGGATNVVLLAQLNAKGQDETKSFSSLLKESIPALKRGR